MINGWFREYLYFILWFFWLRLDILNRWTLVSYLVNIRSWSWSQILTLNKAVRPEGKGNWNGDTSRYLGENSKPAWKQRSEFQIRSDHRSRQDVRCRLGSYTQNVGLWKRTRQKMKCFEEKIGPWMSSRPSDYYSCDRKIQVEFAFIPIFLSEKESGAEDDEVSDPSFICGGERWNELILNIYSFCLIYCLF